MSDEYFKIFFDVYRAKIVPLKNLHKEDCLAFNTELAYIPIEPFSEYLKSDSFYLNHHSNLILKKGYKIIPKLISKLNGSYIINYISMMMILKINKKHPNWNKLVSTKHYPIVFHNAITFIIPELDCQLKDYTYLNYDKEQVRILVLKS